MTETARRTRFARLYSDGSIGVCSASRDFSGARAELIGSSDDPDVELLEVEINVVRSHGKPKLREVTDRYVSCPTCGEEIYVSREVSAP